MPQSGVVAWSQTVSENATADSAVNWAEGMAPSSVNNSARGQMSSVAKYRDDTAGSLTTGGTMTAFTLTTNQLFSSLSEVLDGQEIAVRFHTANGSSPTLNVDSLGAKALKINATEALPEGFIAADSIWRLTYDNSIPAFILNGVAKVFPGQDITVTGTLTGGDLVATDNLTVGDDATIGGDLAVTGGASASTMTVSEGTAPSTPASGKATFYADTNSQAHFINDVGTDRLLTGFSGQLLQVRHTASSGIDSGATSSTTWNTRPLNNVTTNEIASASLSSNQISLPAGTYFLQAAASGGPTARQRQLRLRNISDGSTILVGLSTDNTSGSSPHSPPSLMSGRFSLAGTKTLELQYYTAVGSATQGFGVPVDGGEIEVFTDCLIWRIG